MLTVRNCINFIARSFPSSTNSSASNSRNSTPRNSTNKPTKKHRRFHFSRSRSPSDDFPLDTASCRRDSNLTSVESSPSNASTLGKSSPTSGISSPRFRSISVEDVDVDHFIRTLNHQLNQHIMSAAFVQHDLIKQDDILCYHLSHVEATCIYKLPNHVIIEILSYLSLTENLVASTACKKFHEFCEHDYLWKPFYVSMFATAIPVNDNRQPYLPANDFKSECRERLHHPMIGDRIQTFWTGQFILAQQGPYRGKAWWFADVFDRRFDETSKSYQYHIRYEGWQNSWDEWVSRDRIRWYKGLDVSVEVNQAVSPAAAVDGTQSESQSSTQSAVKLTQRDVATARAIMPSNRVELQISGRLCTAWLECTVAEVIPGRDEGGSYVPPVYLIRDAIVGQELRVGRESLRALTH